MPCVKVKGGWKIRRSKGGVFPKVYRTKNLCEIRILQMEAHKDKKKK